MKRYMLTMPLIWGLGCGQRWCNNLFTCTRCATEVGVFAKGMRHWQLNCTDVGLRLIGGNCGRRSGVAGCRPAARPSLRELLTGFMGTV